MAGRMRARVLGTPGSSLLLAGLVVFLLQEDRLLAEEANRTDAEVTSQATTTGPGHAKNGQGATVPTKAPKKKRKKAAHKEPTPAPKRGRRALQKPPGDKKVNQKQKKNPAGKERSPARRRGAKAVKKLTEGTEGGQKKKAKTRAGRDRPRAPRGRRNAVQLLLEVIKDSPEYQALERDREAKKVVGRYTDEETVPIEEDSFLEQERQKMLSFDADWNTWLTTLLLSIMFFAAAVGAMVARARIHGGWQDDPDERTDQRRLALLLKAILVITVVVGAFADWKRRRTNKKWRRQQSYLDRLLYEAHAGVHPQKEAVLGPSDADIKKHEKELEKKKKEFEAAQN